MPSNTVGTDVDRNASLGTLTQVDLDKDQEQAAGIKGTLQKMSFDDGEKPSIRSGDRMGLLIALTGMACMFIYTWILILSSNPFSLGYFGFHPPFQILAMTCFTYGIVTLQPTTLAQPKAKAHAFSRHHLFMFFIGFPSIAAGSLAILYNKKVKGYSHFETWHGILGITALAWMLIQILLGGGSVWFNGRIFGGNPKAKAVYKYHRASGYPLFVLLFVVIHLGGAWSSFAMNNMSIVARFLVFLVAPAMVLFGTAIRIRFDKMPIF